MQYNLVPLLSSALEEYCKHEYLVARAVLRHWTALPGESSTHDVKLLANFHSKVWWYFLDTRPPQVKKREPISIDIAKSRQALAALLNSSDPELYRQVLSIAEQPDGKYLLVDLTQLA